MIDEMLDDLAEARGKIETVRDALERAQGGDYDQVRAAIARLERIEADVAKVAGKLVGRVEAGEVTV